MLPALILTSLAAAALLAGCVFLYARQAAARDATASAEGQLQQARVELDKHRQGNGELVRQLERATAAREEAQKQFDAAQQRAREAFDAAASAALQQASQQFLQLATQTFTAQKQDATAQLEQRKQAVEALLKPVREQLEQHARAVHEVEKNREGAYQALRGTVGELAQQHAALSQQTATLAAALRGSAQQRGRWGELTLRRIAELAGMVAHCDFAEQVTMWKGDDRQRPDMVVRLPSQRCVVIDAKAVGGNYLAALEAVDEPTRRQRLTDHVRDIESRVRDLSSKAYTQQLDGAFDFVVLFLPGESFLHPAVELKPDLLEASLRSGVLIATPTILIALLRAVACGWREERLAENAAKVRDLGVELHERLATATGYVEKLGKSLDGAVKAYNQFVGSFESRVLTSARRFKDLSADSQKELPAEGQVAEIETAPRQLTTEPTA